MLQRLLWLLLILLLVTIGLGASLFANQDPVALTFMIWQTPAISVFWWLIVALGIGVIIGVFSGFWMSVQRRLEVRRLRRSLATANAELERLRDVTLKG